MIEEIVCNYLTKELGIGAYPEKPSPRPKKYILIEKTGGSSKNYISSATLAIQSIDESKYKAAILNERVKKVMNKIIELSAIGGIHLNSEGDFTDGDTKEYKYQSVYEIKYY